MKKSTTHLILLLWIGATFLVFSCQTKKEETPEQRRERVEKAVQKKLADKRRDKLTKCKNEAILIAEKRVDSLLLAEAKMMQIDTTNKPIKPIKPLPPIVNPPKDSAAVQPLFEEIPDTLK